MSSTESNKRSSARVNALVTVYCENSKRFIAAYSLDLSRGGIFVRTKEPFVKGERVDMEFVLPECDAVLKAVGEVRWVVEKDQDAMNSGKAQQAGMGIEFVEIDSEVVTNLREYVEALTGQKWELG